MSNGVDQDAQMDDELAAFADQVLNSRQTGSQEAPDASEPELYALQQTVQQLENELGQAQPAQELHDRLLSHVQAEYRRAYPQPTTAPVPNKSAVSRFMAWLFPPAGAYQSAGARQRAHAFRYATVTLVVLLSAFFLFPALGEELPGAVLGSKTIVPFVLGAFLAFSIFFLVDARRKKK